MKLLRAALCFGALMAMPLVALAQPDEGEEPAAVDKKPHPFFVGMSFGAGYAHVTLPELATPKLVGPVLALHAGYTVAPHWAVSLELTNFEQSVSRGAPGEAFSSAATWDHVLAGSDSAVAKGGGWVKDSVLLLTTAGPRVDYTLFGEDGPFVGAAGGVAVLSGIASKTGITETARAGVRLRPVPVLTVSLEAGVQGEQFSQASAVIGYGALQGSAHF